MLKSAAVSLVILLAAGPVVAAEKPASAKPPAAKPAPPPTTPDVKPYDAQLLRLAEILGVLTYLRDLCGAKDADVWHGRMQALIEAEGTSQTRKDRLAGAYNSGIQGYRLSYRTCTPNALVVIDRFLVEASHIAKAVENRFGAT